jgi:hypothetical protein
MDMLHARQYIETVQWLQVAIMSHARQSLLGRKIEFGKEEKNRRIETWVRQEQRKGSIVF